MKCCLSDVASCEFPVASITRSLRRMLRRLGNEEREEAVQDCLFQIVATSARRPELAPESLVPLTVRHYCSGGHSQERQTSIHCKYSWLNNRSTRNPQHIAHLPNELFDPGDDPAAIALCRIDYSAWHENTSPKKAAIVDLAIESETGMAIAEIVNVSGSYVSQVLAQFKAYWTFYCYPKP